MWTSNKEKRLVDEGLAPRECRQFKSEPKDTCQAS